MISLWPRNALLVAAMLGATPLAAAERAILFVFDTSGSLRDGDLERGRALARELTAGLGPHDRAGVMTFDDRAILLAPLAADPPAFAAALEQIHRAGRYSVVHDALYDAARLLADSGAARRAIVLLSDGRDENSALLFEDAERELTEARVAVFVVGVGARLDPRFLRRLAKLRDGEFYPLEELSDPAALAATVLARIDALEPVPTPTPEPTPQPTPAPAPSSRRPRPSVPPAGGPADAPVEPGAGPSGALLSLEVAALFLGIALAIVLLQRYFARRRSAPRTVPYESHLPAAPAFEPVRSPGDSLAPPSFDVTRSAAGGSDVALHADSMPAPEVLATIPVGSTPPVRLARSLHEDETDDEPLDPLSRTVVTGQGPSPAGEFGMEDEGGQPFDRTFLLELKPTLVVRKGRNSGETFLVRDDGDTFIGRGQVNHLVLADKAVSTRHARISAEGKVFTLHDLQSTNGTYLNDQRLDRGQEAQLREGDLVRVGETELEFRIEPRRR